MGAQESLVQVVSVFCQARPPAAPMQPWAWDEMEWSLVVQSKLLSCVKDKGTCISVLRKQVSSYYLRMWMQSRQHQAQILLQKVSVPQTQDLAGGLDKHHKRMKPSALVCGLATCRGESGVRVSRSWSGR